ncbi:MAG: flippase [Candidatus Gracilibacteria bacterium]|nr:flippase [Candidatus Gracilibacteria bacterium]
MKQKIAKLKHGLKNNKTIVGNIFSLGTLQIFNYIIPLITLPYVLRILGPEKFGVVAFMGAFVGYFLIIVNYGFSLTTTRDISIHREDNKKISEIFWNVISIKLILSILSFIFSLIIVFSFEIFSNEYLVFLFSFIMIFGDVFFPIWMFQGMEKMKYITIINVIVKSLFLLPIFIFVKTIDDYYLVPLISSLSFITTGIIAFIMAIRVFRIQFVAPSVEVMKYQLVEGWHVFVSTLFISLYTTSTTFILGLFTNNTVVGYYSSAEKVVKAFQGLVGIISQAAYPNVAQKLKGSKDKTIEFLQKITIIIGGITFIMSITLFIGSELIVNLLFGKEFLNSVAILKILSFMPFIIGLASIFINLTMLNFGYKKEVSKIYIKYAIISIFISIPLTLLYNGVGMAISVLLTEIFITLDVFFFLKKKGINLIYNK